MLEKFHYVVGDTEIVLPKFEDIEVGVIRKIRRLSQIDQIFTLIEHYLDEGQLVAFDTLKRSELEDFSNAWRTGSSVTLGESSASSNS
ncbi:hypothetical protein [Microbacterium maritypicum]|uniref:Uncharacterized protein n=1 Tax=Microbacterium maritypicum MF109 TaxID=1333857 RepID=T5KTS9_MICMQ|nr:hypothetical protein [Microbacterium liquefaciens]EQM83424.1 hypothetical protein L687_12455 [Microbacterium maritypicum MF109]